MSTNDPDDLSSLTTVILEAWSQDLKWNLFDATGGAQWVSSIPSDHNLINEETTRRMLSGIVPDVELLARLDSDTQGRHSVQIRALQSPATQQGNPELLSLAQVFRDEPDLQRHIVERGLLAHVEHPVDAVIELDEDGRREAAVDWLASMSANPELKRLRIAQFHDRLLAMEVHAIGCFAKPFWMPLHTSDSALPGQWVCIAGVNGAGKSTLLQGLALALLGTHHALELGTNRLSGLCSTHGSSGSVHVETTRGTRALIVYAAPHTHVTGTGRTWRTLVAYGAGRNLSDTQTPYTTSMGSRARRVVTLFDPLASVAYGDILGGRAALSDAAVHLVTEAARAILGMTLEFELTNDGQRLRSAGFDATDGRTSPLRLPDGYRSTLSWLGDLCIAWCEDHPDVAKPSTEQVDAIVLLDEIDLHLHARLQRVLVPRLRQTFPEVSWVVTTHSPMVLASFDASELRLLDDHQPSGLREVDRPVVGFSSDEIYRYLLETEPHSEEFTRQAEMDEPDVDLAVALEAGPTVTGPQAEANAADLKRRLSAFLGKT